MFRSKQDVDRHVSEIIKKIDNQQERHRRGYNFARMYYQVKESESAKKYLLGFLSVKDHHAPAHKLLGQICETAGDIEKALQSYKRSLEIDPKQKELVLKICELYCNLSVDCETAKYWVERADRLYPHNDIVFRLKERIMNSKGDPDRKELETLITTELSYQPNNLDLLLRHIKLYLDTGRAKEAFSYIVKIENKGLFLNSTEWYDEVVEVFETYQEEFNQELDINFYIYFLSALDKLVTLTLSDKSLTWDRATDVLRKFDQQLQNAVSRDFAVDGAWGFFLDYMKGQLYMHLGSLCVQRARKDRNNYNETVRISSALYLMAYSFKPSNVLQALWFLDMEEQQKAFARFYHQGAMRTSFVGHSIIHLCGNEDESKWLSKIKLEVCLKQVQENAYSKLFGHVNQAYKSFFLNDRAFTDATLEFPMQSSLTEYDKSFYTLCPDSLHNLVWLHLQQNDRNVQVHQNLLRTAFKGLQYSNSNLSRGSCESLCVLDLEAYLIAVLYTTSLNLDRRSVLNGGTNPLSVPPNIAESLCTTEQTNWWQSAYGLVNQKFKEKFSEHRQILQRGLEVIRGIGIHGLEVQLVVHLARSFSDKASTLPQESPTKQLDNKNRKFNLDRASALESRAVHYWNLAVGMLDTLASNRTLREPKDRMFGSYSKSLSREEIVSLREEGQLYLACKLINSGKLEEAIEHLEKMISPFASYYMAMAYKKIAFKEDKSNVRSALLHKARDALYTTMDRIKGDPTHSLNEEIHMDIEDIENEIENQLNCTNANNVHSDHDEYDGNTPPPRHSNQVMTPLGISNNFHSTPRISSPFVSSRTNYKSDSSRVHIQPSPERLDAQIRSLTMAQTTSVKTLVEQQKSLLNMNTAVVEGLKEIKEVITDMKESFVTAMGSLKLNNDVSMELKKQLDELLSLRKTHSKGVPKKPAATKPLQEDVENHDFANYEGHEYLDYYVEDGVDSYRPGGHQNYAYSRLNRTPATNVSYPPPPIPHYGYHQYPHNLPPPPPESQHHYYPHGLPFSEGQPLPQFQFHVPPSVNKPPSMAPIPPPAAAIPWSKPSTLPHTFQIPMPPPSTTFGSSPSVLSTPAPFPSQLASTGSPPKGAGDFSFSSRTSEPGIVSNRSRQDSDVFSDTDVEREVMGDFKPVIPLPDEVIVETGEEDETVLFEERAKLFRFVDKEWKERGIGKVKILRQEQSGRIRLLMRRDQVLKVCANHAIKPYMEIQPLKDSDKALTWAAQDFADETVKLEKFCIRFKNVDTAALFKKAFEDAVQFVSLQETSKASQPPLQLSSLITVGLRKPCTWTCSTCLVSNPDSKTSCIACESPKPSSVIKNVEVKSPFGVKSINENLPTTAATINASPETKTSNTVFGNLASSLSFGKPSTKPVFENFSFSTVSGVVDNATKTSTDPVPNLPFSGFKPTPKLQQSTTAMEKPVSVFGGFTFNSTPVVAEKIEPSENSVLVVSTKSKDGPQVTKLDSSKSPFSGFSFSSDNTIKLTPEQSKGKESSNSKFPFSGFSFESNKPSTISSQPVFGSNSAFASTNFASLTSKSSPIVVTVNKSNHKVPGDSVEESTPEEFEPTVEFKPVVPLPALVEAKTGEEDSVKLFGERVRLFRFDTDTKEWKERGIGELKILEEKDGKFRILMRREQVLKICANHYIMPEMQVSPIFNSEKARTWIAQDFSEMTLQQMNFSARFKNADLAKQFQQVFEECKLKTLQKKDDIQDPCVGSSNLFTSIIESWDCKSCQTKNEKNAFTCASCHKSKSVTIQWECFSCKVQNDENNSSCKSCHAPKPNSLKPLSEICKVDPSSWECQICYVRNTSSDVCVACETQKPGSDTKSTSIFGQSNFGKPANSGFVFGSKELSQSKFQFGTNTSDHVQNQNSSLKPLSEICKVDPSSWECQICYVRNTSSDVCVACETRKPGVDTKTTSVFGQLNFGKSVDSGFVFGAKELSQSKFQFGTSPSVFGNLALSPPKSVPPSTTASTFVFGSPATATSFSSTIFSKPEDLTTKPTDPTEFKFGSPQKYEFNFSGVRARSPSKGPKSPKSPGVLEEEEEDDEVEPSDVDNIYFQPVIPLPPEVDVKTGEEGETILFCKRAKLFRFVQSEWKERGIGDIKILHNSQQNHIRLLMRRDQVLKVCLNHYLTDTIKFSWKSKNSLSWSVTDFSENTPSPELFAIRFKLPESAVEFKDAIDSALNLIGVATVKSPSDVKKVLDFTPQKSEADTSKTEKSPSYNETLSSFSFSLNKESTSPFSLSARFGSPSASNETGNTSTFFSKTPESVSKTPESISKTPESISKTPESVSKTPEAVSKTPESKIEPSDDVQLVHEVKATLEQIAAAQKLMLPPNFYLYENKPPCPGCRGCDEEDRKNKAQSPVVERIPSSNLNDESNSQNPADSLFSNASASLFSFADLASKVTTFSGPVPKASTSPLQKASFPGAGAPVFGQNISQNTDDDNEEVAQAPDVHFEPVIPLPDLIEVKTGEEDETVFFCSRAKLYLFDVGSRNWKERGVGDLKILQHNEKCRFRLVQRREQVHKVACNHIITPNMDLNLMSTSDSSLCWSALDFSDGDSKSCQFAVRFKNKEILQEFRLKFEEAKTILRNAEQKSYEITQATAPVAVAEEEDEDDEDEDAEDEDILFGDYVEFEVLNERQQKYEVVGEGELQVIYDDSVYGYRILMKSQDRIICDHIIAIQTCLSTNGTQAMWGAVDISVYPPQKRQFRATFETRQATEQFLKVFEEGKEIAFEAEILEKSGEIVIESPHNRQ